MTSNEKERYADPNYPGNSKKYHTGKPCVTLGCNNPAGTAWSPYWCFECNRDRMKSIDTNFKKITAKFRDTETGDAI